MLSELIQFAKELPYILFLDRVCNTFGVKESDPLPNLNSMSMEEILDSLNGLTPAELEQKRLLRAKRRELEQLEEALRLKEREQELLERKQKLERRLCQP